MIVIDSTLQTTEEPQQLGLQMQQGQQHGRLQVQQEHSFFEDDWGYDVDNYLELQ
jgi:hypothetical protein